MPSKVVTSAEEWEAETGLKLQPAFVITPIMPRSLRTMKTPSTKAKDMAAGDKTTKQENEN
ncbi:MAG: hypothetical protein ACJ0UT_03260 [Candidatus Latescibacterota bacterium]